MQTGALLYKVYVHAVKCEQRAEKTNTKERGRSRSYLFALIRTLHFGG